MGNVFSSSSSSSPHNSTPPTMPPAMPPAMPAATAATFPPPPPPPSPPQIHQFQMNRFDMEHIVLFEPYKPPPLNAQHRVRFRNDDEYNEFRKTLSATSPFPSPLNDSTRRSGSKVRDREFVFSDTWESLKQSAIHKLGFKFTYFVLYSPGPPQDENNVSCYTEIFSWVEGEERGDVLHARLQAEIMSKGGAMWYVHTFWEAPPPSCEEENDSVKYFFTMRLSAGCPTTVKVLPNGSEKTAVFWPLLDSVMWQTLRLYRITGNSTNDHQPHRHHATGRSPSPPPLLVDPWCPPPLPFAYGVHCECVLSVAYSLTTVEGAFVEDAVLAVERCSHQVLFVRTRHIFHAELCRHQHQQEECDDDDDNVRGGYHLDVWCSKAPHLRLLHGKTSQQLREEMVRCLGDLVDDEVGDDEDADGVVGPPLVVLRFQRDTKCDATEREEGSLEGLLRYIEDDSARSFTAAAAASAASTCGGGSWGLPSMLGAVSPCVVRPYLPPAAHHRTTQSNTEAEVDDEETEDADDGSCEEGADDATGAAAVPTTAASSGDVATNNKEELREQSNSSVFDVRQQPRDENGAVQKLHHIDKEVPSTTTVDDNILCRNSIPPTEAAMPTSDSSSTTWPREFMWLRSEDIATQSPLVKEEATTPAIESVEMERAVNSPQAHKMMYESTSASLKRASNDRDLSFSSVGIARDVSPILPLGGTNGEINESLFSVNEVVAQLECCLHTSPPHDVVVPPAQYSPPPPSSESSTPTSMAATNSSSFRPQHLSVTQLPPMSSSPRSSGSAYGGQEILRKSLQSHQNVPTEVTVMCQCGCVFVVIPSRTSNTATHNSAHSRRSTEAALTVPPHDAANSDDSASRLVVGVTNERYWKRRGCAGLKRVREGHDYISEEAATATLLYQQQQQDFLHQHHHQPPTISDDRPSSKSIAATAALPLTVNESPMLFPPTPQVAVHNERDDRARQHVTTLHKPQQHRAAAPTSRHPGQTRQPRINQITSTTMPRTVHLQGTRGMVLPSPDLRNAFDSPSAVHFSPPPLMAQRTRVWNRSS
ncbi:Hypothetical protein, putative [Bodo saltans]|uniref:Uncharacterized protein n=1 Tax=Bodo saltans TaxID=75058 RepID=A0A0S4JAT1_BODSA|nr:Hypothetical protein, putative [Bodo saltans]|eukprot:CUG87049.1 Hypothetical protein, putative [Bodo saltans]